MMEFLEGISYFDVFVWTAMLIVWSALWSVMRDIRHAIFWKIEAHKARVRWRMERERFEAECRDEDRRDRGRFRVINGGRDAA